MVKINYKLWLLLGAWFLLALALPRLANASSLTITEVMYNPSGSDTGREWIEVKNISTTTVALAGSNWRFNDGSSHMISATGEAGELAPNEYAIIADDPIKFKSEYPNFTGVIYDSSFSLKNSDNKVSFINNGNEDCSVNYLIAWGANDDGKSLELTADSSWQVSFLLGGTPGSDNSIWPDNLPPTLQVVLPTKVEVNKEIKMIATVVDPENKPIEVNWQFGDGESGNGIEVGHVYSNEGSYTVVTKAFDVDYVVYATSTVTVTEASAINSGVSSNNSWANVELSELLPNPNGAEADGEWIELYNNSPSSVSVDRWQLGDGSSRRFTFKVENHETHIESYGYLLVKRSVSGISLNNEGEKVVLFAPDGSVIDQVSYDKALENYVFAKQDRTWQWSTMATPNKLNEIVLVEDKSDLTEEVKSISEKTETKVLPITLTTVPLLPLDKQVLESIRLNEIFPNPKGKDDNEWIEIKNIGATTVDLFGYYIDDEEGGSKPYKFSTTTLVIPGGYYVLSKNTTKLSLGNIKDSVRLLDHNKESIWEVKYDQVKENFSYSFDTDNDDWQWTDVPTINKDNIFVSENDGVLEINASLNETGFVNINSNQQMQPLGQVLDLPDKTEVLTQGVIIIQPDLFAKNIFYLADYDEVNNKVDLNTKIQIYFNNSKKLSYKIGDVVEIIGVMSTSKNERRIKINSNEQLVLVKQIKNIAFNEVSLSDVAENESGSLIKISGQLLDKKGSALTVGVGDDTVKVYIKKASMLAVKDFSKGDWLMVTGIIDNQAGKEIRLLPRQISDIEKVVVAGVNEPSQNSIATITKEKISLEKFNHYFDKSTIIYSLGFLVLIIILWEGYEYFRKTK